MVFVSYKEIIHFVIHDLAQEAASSLSSHSSPVFCTRYVWNSGNPFAIY